MKIRLLSLAYLSTAISLAPLTAARIEPGNHAASDVRVTTRDIGPETGFSGSGTGFTFNRDTRQVILPSSQRIFRSFNGGDTWAPLALVSPSAPSESGYQPPFFTEGAYFVRQNPRQPQTLYAVGAHMGNLARSTDFGTTWTQLEDADPQTTLLQFADVAVHEAAPNVVLALHHHGSLGGDAPLSQYPVLWRSEDGGTTFAPQWNTGLPIEIVDPDTLESSCSTNYSNIATTPTDPDVVYVVQDGGDHVCPPGIHKSVDGGLTFTRLATTPPGVPVQVFPDPTRRDVLFVQTTYPFNSGIWRSVDAGANFDLLSNGLPNQNYFVSFDRRNRAHLFIAGRYGVFRSTDGGDTFQPLGLSAAQLGRFATNVTLDPSNSAVVYVNTWNGNFKSTDGGATFTAINVGWKAALIRAVAFDHASDPNLYLATDHGIFRTHTRGHDFELVSRPDANDTYMLAIAPSNSKVILAFTRPDVFSPGTLYRSVDGGQTWTASVVGGRVGHLSVRWIAVDPQDAKNVYAEAGFDDGLGPSTGFFKSTDAGATFVFNPSAGFGFSSLAIDPLDPNVMYGGTPNIPYRLDKSTNAGGSFAPLQSQTAFSLDFGTRQILINPQDSNDMFIAGGYVLAQDPSAIHDILRSTDGGLTFAAADSGLPSQCLLVMNPEEPALLYGWSVDAGLFATRNGGAAWNAVPAYEVSRLPTLGVLPNTMLIDPERPKLLYLLGGSLLEVEIHDK